MMTQVISSNDLEQFHTYLSTSGKNLETVKKYVRDIRRMSAYLTDHALSFTQSALDEYIKSLQQDGYGIRSINSAIASIKSFCRFSGREDLQCKSFRVRRKNNLDEQMCLTADEYMTLIHTAEDNCVVPAFVAELLSCVVHLDDFLRGFRALFRIFLKKKLNADFRMSEPSSRVQGWIYVP